MFAKRGRHSMKRLVLAFLFLVWPVAAQAKVFDPLKPGPYPVGVTTTVFVDHSRTDPATKEARTLVTEIWYPATDDARGLPKNKLSNFFPGGFTPQIEQFVKLAYKKSAAEIDQLFWDE